MNKSLKILASISIAFLLGCSNEKVVFEKDNYKIIFNSKEDSFKGIRYYGDGSIKALEELNSQYKIDGVAKQYYENGVLQLHETFRDGIKEGPEVGYYPSGNIEYKGQNDFSKMEGTWYWYSDNPNSQKFVILANYINGKYFGSQVEIDSVTLNPIIRFYSFEGLLGILKYDNSASEKRIVQGDLTYCMYNKSYLQVGDNFDVTLFVGHGVKSEVRVKLEFADQSEKKSEIVPSIVKVHDYMSKVNWTYEIKENRSLNLLFEIELTENNEVFYQSDFELPIIVD